jgi:hypothetical protein
VRRTIASRDSSVGKKKDGLDGSGLSPSRARFSFLHSVQTDSATQPASYPMGTGALCSGRAADHSLPPSTEVKIGGAIPPFPPLSSWYSV